MGLLSGIIDVEGFSEASLDLLANPQDFFGMDTFSFLAEVGTNISIGIFEPAFADILDGGGSIADRIDQLEDIVGEGNVGQATGPDGDTVNVQIPGTDATYIYDVGAGSGHIYQPMDIYPLPRMPDRFIIDPYAPHGGWVEA